MTNNRSTWDLRPIEYAHPGYVAREVGETIELVPEKDISQEERDALRRRMADYVVDRLSIEE